MKDQFRVVVCQKGGIIEAEETVILETTFLSIALMEAKNIVSTYSLASNQVKVLVFDDNEWVPYKSSTYTL